MDGIKCIVFDMDGLMIDSEPIWEEVETAVFAEYGLHLTHEAILETTGLRIDEVVQHRWKDQADWGNATQKEVADRIVDRMVASLKKDPRPFKGLQEAIDFAKSKPSIEAIGLASSSPMRLIEAALEGLKLNDGTFKAVCSAEHEPFGKPHPGVYIRCAQLLGVDPTACLALEDSLNGCISAKAAKMKCFAIPDRTRVDNVDKFKFTDGILEDLSQLRHKLL